MPDVGLSACRDGKPTSFIMEETEVLKGALVDLSERIRRAADSL